MKYFDTIIVEPDSGARERLKSAATALPDFRKVVFARSFEECRATLDRDFNTSWDIVFVTNRLGREKALAFISEARYSDRLQDAAFILCLKPSDLTDTAIASGIAGGADGILCEPFSADGLRQCATIAVKVKVNNGKQRVILALGVVIPLVIRAIDAKSQELTNAAVASALELDDPALKLELGSIERSCRAIGEIAASANTSYTGLIAEIFRDFEEKASHRRAYAGASKRVQMKLDAETRITAEVKQRLLALESEKAAKA